MNVEFYLKQAQDLKTKLDELRPLSSEIEVKIMQKLRLDWNFHSSHLKEEGIQYTYGETQSLIDNDEIAEGKPEEDSETLLGHDEAIEIIYDYSKDNAPLT